LAQSLLIELKNQDPACRIDVLIRDEFFPLLDRMPQVARSIPLDMNENGGGVYECRRIGKNLRKSGYDQAIILSGLWEDALIAFFANVSKRTGYLKGLGLGVISDVRPYEETLLPLTIQKYVALGLDKSESLPPDCPLPELDISLHNQLRVAEKFSIHRSSRPVLGFCLGSEFGLANQWSTENFVAIAREKYTQGWDVWLFGNDENSRERSKAICKEVSICQDFSECADFGETIDLLSMTDVVLTNNSGLMYIASALKKNVLAIFGAANRKNSISLNPAVKIFYEDLECAPCLQTSCEFHHYQCLNQIAPDRILAAMAEL